jgi:hypothetical protein
MTMDSEADIAHWIKTLSRTFCLLDQTNDRLICLFNQTMGESFFLKTHVCRYFFYFWLYNVQNANYEKLSSVFVHYMCMTIVWKCNTCVTNLCLNQMFRLDTAEVKDSGCSLQITT